MVNQNLRAPDILAVAVAVLVRLAVQAAQDTAATEPHPQYLEAA
jgi:hypothetical protein